MSVDGRGQTESAAFGKERVYKYEGFILGVSSIQKKFEASLFERSHAFNNQLAHFRPHHTAHLQSPPSYNAVSVIPFCPDQPGLRSLSEVAGNPHPRLRAKNPNVQTVQAPHKYLLGRVTTSKALISIMRPCGPGKMPGSVGSNLGNNTSMIGPPIGRRGAMENSDVKGMLAYCISITEYPFTSAQDQSQLRDSR